MKQFGLLQSIQIRKWGFQRANLLDRYIKTLCYHIRAGRNLHRVYIMEQAEFIEKFNNASGEIKNLVRDCLKGSQQPSESLE